MRRDNVWAWCIAGAVGLAWVGCQAIPLSLSDRFAASFDFPRSPASESDERNSDLSTAESDVDSARVTELVAQLQEQLTSGEFQRDLSTPLLDRTAVPAARGVLATPFYNWVYIAHPKLEATPLQPKEPADHARAARHETSRTLRWLFSQPDADAVDAAALQLVKRNDFAGWAAAILIARRDPARGRSFAESLAHLTSRRLQPTTSVEGKPSVLVPSVPVSVAAAASETWLTVLRSDADSAVEAWAEPGVVLDSTVLSDDVTVALWRMLAREIPPRRIPGLAASLGAQSNDDAFNTTLKLAAMEACLIHAWVQAAAGTMVVDPYPPGMDSLRRETDPQFRRLFVRWVAWSRHPEAVAVIQQELLNADLRSREDAVAGLVALKSSQARPVLEHLAGQTDDVPRSLGVKGLAHDDIAKVTRFARDESPRVRLAVAKAAADWPRPDVWLLLRDMTADRSLDVQAAAVASVREWPEELALPLYLEALSGSSMKTRELALDALRDRVGFRPSFPVEANESTRRAELGALADACGISTDVWNRLRREASTRPQPRSRESVDSIVAELLASSKADVDEWRRIAATLESSHAAVQACERGLDTAGDELRQFIEQELLPRLSPIEQALFEMNSNELAARRKAAGSLRSSSSSAAWTDRQLRLLNDRLAREPDRQVWQSCLASLPQDRRHATRPVLLMSLNHHWPDIRRAGCEAIVARPSPDFAVPLLPLLHDRDRATQAAAIEAAAACRNAIVLDGQTRGEPPLPGLRPLLASTDADLRWRTLEAMATLDDDAASAELVRLLSSTDAATRQRAIKAMVHSERDRFLDALIAAAWTERTAIVQRELAEAMESMVEPARRPAPLPAIADALRSPTEWSRYVRAWQSWRTTRRDSR